MKIKISNEIKAPGKSLKIRRENRRLMKSDAQEPPVEGDTKEIVESQNAAEGTVRNMPIKIVNAYEAVEMGKMRIANATENLIRDLNNGNLVEDESGSASKDVLVGIPEIQKTLRQNESEITFLREQSNRRAADLAALTRYLQKFEEERESYKASLVAAKTDAAKVLESCSKCTGHEARIEALKNSIQQASFENAVRSEERSREDFSKRIEALLVKTYSKHEPLWLDAVKQLAIASGLFDYEWYIKKYSLNGMDAQAAFDHYLTKGSAMEYNPGPLFDASFYISSNRDVEDAKINPLVHYIQFGVFEQRKISKVQDEIKVVIIMMMKNEMDLLYPWVLYHGSRFGYHNLYILDNGSSAPVLERLRQVEKLGVKVNYSYKKSEDFLNKGSIVAKIINKMDLSDPADIYFPLDCDEFIGVESGSGTYSFSSKGIVAELSKHVKSSNALEVAATFDNHPSFPGFFKRSAGQRKTFFAKCSCEHLDRGFSNSIVKSGDKSKRKTSIIYIHYHFKPFKLIQEHTRQKLRVLGVTDFSEAALRRYVNEKKTGFHAVQHLLTSEAVYYKKTNKDQFNSIQEFVDAFTEFGMKLPFDD